MPTNSGPVNASSTAEVTSLAAHLRRLADRVDQLDACYDELTDIVAEQVLPQLTEHTTRVQELVETVNCDCDGPVDWTTMDAERAAIEWNALSRWIEQTLVPWFEITRNQLPDCWALHRPAVIELAWLHNTYRAAHRPDAAPHLAPEWHTRWRPAALRAVHDAIPRRGSRTCGPGQHLISEDERVRRQFPREHRPGFPGVPVSVPSDELADRGCWQHFLDQAVTADLAWRRSSAGRG